MKKLGALYITNFYDYNDMTLFIDLYINNFHSANNIILLRTNKIEELTILYNYILYNFYKS